MEEVHKICQYFLFIFSGKWELTFLKKMFIMETRSKDNSFYLCIIYLHSEMRILIFLNF